MKSYSNKSKQHLLPGPTASLNGLNAVDVNTEDVNDDKADDIKGDPPCPGGKRPNDWNSDGGGGFVGPGLEI